MPGHRRLVGAVAAALLSVSGWAGSDVASAAPLVASAWGPATLFDVNPATGARTNPRAMTGTVTPIGLAYSPNGQLYTIDTGENSRLYTVNTATGAVTPVGPLNIGFIAEGDLAFAPDGTLYCTGYTESFVGDMLLKVDTTTGAATRIGARGFFSDLSGLAWYNGKLLALETGSNLDGTPKLHTLNTTTGAIETTVSLSINFNPAYTNGAGALAVDPDTNTAYVVFSGSQSLYTVNPATGNLTLSGFMNLTTPTGLAFLAPPVPEPGSIALIGLGATALLVRRRKC